MGNSLQDQLLKAGLVNEQKVKQTRSAKRKKKKKHGGVPAASDESYQRAREAASEKARRDRELNAQRQEEIRRRATLNEMRQLIHAHRVPRGGGDVPYSFLDGDSLKRIYVTAEQQGRLASGRLAVVRQDTGYELIPIDVAEKVGILDKGLVVVLNRPGDEGGAEDDEYAEYKVPDDLTW